MSRGLCCGVGAARLRDDFALANLGLSMESRFVCVTVMPSALVVVTSQLFAKWVTLATCAKAHWESAEACDKVVLAAVVSW